MSTHVLLHGYKVRDNANSDNSTVSMGSIYEAIDSGACTIGPEKFPAKYLTDVSAEQSPQLPDRTEAIAQQSGEIIIQELAVAA